VRSFLRRVRWVPLSVRQGPRWVRWFWIVSNVPAESPLWRVAFVSHLLRRLGAWLRRHGSARMGCRG
jgi:hypothetical protein